MSQRAGGRVVQENLGDAMIAAISDFARSDLKTVDALEADEFAHVGDATLRKSLAVTFYGARWIYKLGLVLLVRNEEQLAHVRTQIIDYGAVCEGLLSDMVAHASPSRPPPRKFEDLINEAHRAGIIGGPLKDALHDMRRERNTVHLRRRTRDAWIRTAANMFDTALQTIRRTKTWRAAHP